jgi:hypothetical protein
MISEKGFLIKNSRSDDPQMGIHLQFSCECTRDSYTIYHELQKNLKYTITMRRLISNAFISNTPNILDDGEVSIVRYARYCMLRV